ncbi:hypothetical protein OROMI_004681 [Orobanche minor]
MDAAEEGEETDLCGGRRRRNGPVRRMKTKNQTCAAAVNDVIFKVVDGDARNILCEAVEKHNASVLVVGSHGYGAIKRFFDVPLSVVQVAGIPTEGFLFPKHLEGWFHAKEFRMLKDQTKIDVNLLELLMGGNLSIRVEIIVERGPSVGLNISLSRYDLFHGHLFLAKESGRLGILFHAKEYHAYDREIFPYNMGYCQVGSNVAYDNSMNLRNILWLAPLPQKHGWHSREDWDGIYGHIFVALACVGLLVSLKVTAY